MTLQKTLFIIAALQSLAWACDIIENIYLLQWTGMPEKVQEMGVFHVIVSLKWLIALAGIFFAAIVLVLRRKVKVV